MTLQIQSEGYNQLQAMCALDLEVDSVFRKHSNGGVFKGSPLPYPATNGCVGCVGMVWQMRCTWLHRVMVTLPWGSATHTCLMSWVCVCACHTSCWGITFGVQILPLILWMEPGRAATAVPPSWNEEHQYLQNFRRCCVPHRL